MTSEEFKRALNVRLTERNLSKSAVHRQTNLSYATIRKVFQDPMNCRISSVLSVLNVLGCSLDFAIEQRIGDELEQ